MWTLKCLRSRKLQIRRLELIHRKNYLRTARFACLDVERRSARALSLALVICGCATLPASASSFWASSSVPGTPDVTNDRSAVTLGVQFYSDVSGSVTGLRFYKGVNNTGTHIGALWSSTGAQLASVTFSEETASGWQQANFPSPVSIAANTVYVISYFAPDGNYADNQYYGWSALSSAPLHVSGTSPGVFAYGSSDMFPNSTWNGSNYWVDLAFAPSTSTESSYTISGHVNGSAAQLTLSGGASGSTQTNTSGNYTFPGLKDGTYVVAPSESGYVFSPATASASVNGSNIENVNFTATASTAHNVSLSWTASVSAGVSGYNVYRSGASGGPYTLLNESLIDGTSYVDNSVAAGATYYYVVTAVSSGELQSGYSNQTATVVP